MSKECPTGTFWNAISRSCTSCLELCLEVPTMMRQECCGTLQQCPGGLPGAALTTCPANNTNVTNTDSSTTNWNYAWIVLIIAIVAIVALIIYCAIKRRRQVFLFCKKNVESPNAAGGGDHGIQVSPEQQELISVRVEAPGSHPPPPAEDSGNVSSASATPSDAAQHPDNRLSSFPVAHPMSDDDDAWQREETSQPTKIRLMSGADNAHDMSAMDTQARSASSGRSRVSNDHSSNQTMMKSV